MRNHLLNSRWWTAVVLVAGMPGVGCSKPTVADPLRIVLQTSDTLVRPDAPITLTVTATNEGGEPVTWGEGSSSCQLRVIVVVGTDEIPVGLRPCTRDFVPLTLAAGDLRTESWEWRGNIALDGKLDTLPGGEYRLQALAGTLARSDPLVIRVEQASDSTAGT
jgi:hypothetical protein